MAWDVQEDLDVVIACFHILMLQYVYVVLFFESFALIGFHGNCNKLLLEKHFGFVGQNGRGYMENAVLAIF